jgi:putative endonuclease
MRTFYVYIMASKHRTLYTGITNDLERRVYEHKHKVTPGFTSKYNINRLVYMETFNHVRDAIQREKRGSARGKWRWSSQKIQRGKTSAKVGLVKSNAGVLRGVYPEPLHFVQGRSQVEGERVQNDGIGRVAASSSSISHLSTSISQPSSWAKRRTPVFFLKTKMQRFFASLRMTEWEVLAIGLRLTKTTMVLPAME